MVDPQCSIVLSALLQNAGQVVKRDDLISLVWGIDADIYDTSLGYQMHRLRKALGDDYKDPTYIRTLKKRGYIFFAPVEKILNQETIDPAGKANKDGRSGERPQGRVFERGVPETYSNSVESGWTRKPSIRAASTLSTAHQPTSGFDLEPSIESFGAWLLANVSAQKLPRASFAERSLLKMGECTVLRTAVNADGYEDIVMEAQQQPPELKLGIAMDDRLQWEAELKKLDESRVSGISAQVIRFVSELTDDPKARVDYRVVSYAETRAFHEMLQTDGSLSPRYRENTLKVLSDSGTDVPNILATAVVAIIGSDGKEPELVLANRMGRVGGYHGSCWAVSIGEQYMPITGRRRNRIVEADGSIFRSAERGIREELLGDRYSGNLSISVHALVLEDYINNFFFLAIADLRPLTFRELKECWRKSVDSAEHNAIAALPLSEAALFECMQEDALPDHCWTQIQQAELLAVQPGVIVTPDMQRWQPNSHIRLAGCLWYLKDELGARDE
jgi:DNA-binding winged helix-turn-helix (wHTH) protein